MITSYWIRESGLREVIELSLMISSFTTDTVSSLLKKFRAQFQLFLNRSPKP